MAGDPTRPSSSPVELLGRVPFCNVWAVTNAEPDDVVAGDSTSPVELLGRVPFCNVWAFTDAELGERPTASSGTDIAMIVDG